MAQYGLRSPHISCLYYLYFAKGLTATELCERCEEDKATISRSLDYLKTNGYLTYEENGPKHYKAPLILTQKGLKVGGEIAEKIEEVLEKVSIGLTDNQRRSFYKSLNIISNNLENISEN